MEPSSCGTEPRSYVTGPSSCAMAPNNFVPPTDRHIRD
jgi:hypothetical protein